MNAYVETFEAYIQAKKTLMDCTGWRLTDIELVCE